MYNKIVNKNYISLIIGVIFLLIWIIFSTFENKAIIESYSSGNLQNALLQIDSILLLSIIIFLTIILNKKGDEIKSVANSLRIESMGIAILFIASASSYFVFGWLYYISIYYQILGIPTFLLLFYSIFDRELINSLQK